MNVEFNITQKSRYSRTDVYVVAHRCGDTYRLVKGFRYYQTAVDFANKLNSDAEFRRAHDLGFGHSWVMIVEVL